MKKLIVLLVVAVVVGMAFVAVAADKGPAEVKFEAKMGAVAFNHASHQGLADCAACHHTGTFESCRSCHDGTKAPASKDAFHKACKDCHKKEGKGPQKCKECHVK